ncbi:mechanosensitive ion channel family protein [Curvibacter sp. CHRR-16]|uniref:mechanosensitive ion channel family protein n=1 Tax=Curvibacter sp. CHRR-16 TaxID=2835872 RepID=UPI001BDB4A04|nr:mechanosensitive ion channel family protein [Curvibacter sp. CHRR-16]MBT0569128.1 mechanosensitive ion channel family protein [Curvibacter sp. CHRR-16]
MGGLFVQVNDGQHGWDCKSRSDCLSLQCEAAFLGAKISLVARYIPRSLGCTRLLMRWQQKLYGVLWRFCLGTALCYLCISTSGASTTTAAPSAEEAQVTIFNRPLATFRSTLFGVGAQERARRTQRNVLELLDRGGPGVVSVRSEGELSLILLDDVAALSFGPEDVDTVSGQTRDAMLAASVQALKTVVREKQETRDMSALLREAGYVLAATLIAILLWLGLNRLYRFIASWTLQRMGRAMHAFDPAGPALMLGERVLHVVSALLTLLYWSATLLLVYEWLSFSLSRFPFTRAWGEQLHAYLLDSVLLIFSGIASAIPNLFIAGLVFLVARTVIRMLRPLFDRVAAGHLDLGLIDQDTAVISRRLASVLIWLFALAMAFPYLPGAQTEAFRGMSVLVGLMISLGASSMVGQAAGGLILMYTRSIKMGEYVRIGDHEGTITEIGLFTTRIRTGLGEEITLPNSVIIGTATKNYSRTVQGQGFVIDATVTIGYDTPWRQVQAMLCEAARRTEHVLDEPQPRVFQTALSDFYPEYRLVCQAIPSQPRSRAEVLSALHANIQDVFNEYGIQIMSPHYQADPAQEKIVKKENWYAASAQQSAD